MPFPVCAISSTPSPFKNASFAGSSSVGAIEDVTCSIGSIYASLSAAFSAATSAV